MPHSQTNSLCESFIATDRANQATFMLHPELLGLIALPTESPGGGFNSDRTNVFFIIWYYIKLVCMCEGCLVMCGMIGVMNLGFDSFRFMENV